MQAKPLTAGALRIPNFEILILVSRFYFWKLGNMKLVSRILTASALSAEVNWRSWKEEYETEEGFLDLLKDPKSTRFEKFMQEYSLSRTIQSEEKNDRLNDKERKKRAIENRANVRGTLSEIFHEGGNFLTINNINKHSVPKLEELLSEALKEVGIKVSSGNRGRFTSLCSKLLTFHSPKLITPYDRFARRGIAHLASAIKNRDQEDKDKPHNAKWLLESRNSFPYAKKYEDFHTDFFDVRKIFKEQLHKVASAAIKENNDALINRSLDNYAMYIGGRWGDIYPRIHLEENGLITP